MGLLFTGNGSHLFQKVLFAMVSNATSSQKHNVRFIQICFLSICGI